MRTVCSSGRKCSGDDQIGTNEALDKMEVKWKHLNDKYFEGHTSRNASLTITILPESVICRDHCKGKLLQHFYVWHHYDFKHKNGANKKSTLSEDHLWVLKANWNTTLQDTTLTSEKWLLTISNASLTRNHDYPKFIIIIYSYIAIYIAIAS